MDNSHRDDDKLLRALGAQVREQTGTEDEKRLDRRWADYCAGTLAPPEQAALMGEAKGTEEKRLAATFFEPLGEGFKAGLVRELREEIVAGKGSGTARPRGAEARGADRDVSERPAGRGGRLLRWLRGLSGGGHVWSLRLAAVTAALLALVGLSQLGRLTDGPRVGTPRFDVVLVGAEKDRSTDTAAEDRSTDTEEVIFDPDLYFAIQLQPEHPMEHRPDLRVYVRQGASEPERWRAAERAAETSTDGTILIRDPEWGFPHGDWTVCFVIGEDLPSDREMRQQLLDPNTHPPSKRWQLLVEDLLVAQTGGH